MNATEPVQQTRIPSREVLHANPGLVLTKAIVDDLVRIDMRKASAWRVTVAVTARWYQKGCPEKFWMTNDDICAATALSRSTVARAMREIPFIHRPTRSGIMMLDLRPNILNWYIGKTEFRMKERERVKEVRRTEAFTATQRETIEGVFDAASLAIGKPAKELSMPNWVCNMLKLPAGTTYGAGYEHLEKTKDRFAAHKFVGAVLKLIKDERLRGRELVLETAGK